jgi:hypothetical protein
MKTRQNNDTVVGPRVVLVQESGALRRIDEASARVQEAQRQISDAEVVVQKVLAGSVTEIMESARSIIEAAQPKDFRVQMEEEISTIEPL